MGAYNEDNNKTMNKFKSIFITSITVVMLLAVASPVSAAVRCETQYGGNQVCVTTGQLQIDKKIWNSDNSSWVDNLYITDHKFVTGDTVRFRLTVKNVGDNTLHNVKVVDTLPNFLFFTGTTASEFTIDSLNPGENKDFEVESRVVSESQLGVNEACDVNAAEANSNEGEHDKDTAKVCVTKKVLGVTTLPKTGPSNTFLILSLSLFAGLSGLYLTLLRK